MRLFITVILALLFSAARLEAQKTKTKNTDPARSATAAPGTPVTSNVKSLLWEVSGNGLANPSYVFGTMHLMCTENALLSDSLEYGIAQATRVYFEIDMDNMAEMMGLFKYIRMRDGKKLSDLLTAAEYERVKEYFVRNKSILPLSMMETFKPYFIASMISETRMPCESKNGMEEVILKAVKASKKEVKGLESIGFQASVFDSIPYADQARELLKTIDSAGVEDSSTAKMLSVYTAQDMDGIEKLTVEEEGGVASFLDLFLYGRNARWIPLIQAAMKEGPTLFAVGAAHLPGKKGVLDLLKQAGYTVRPMKHRPGTSSKQVAANRYRSTLQSE
ncbi:MAG: TraB/GumN family protein [Flavihumibacter sp.]